MTAVNQAVGCDVSYDEIDSCQSRKVTHCWLQLNDLNHEAIVLSQPEDTPLPKRSAL